MINYGKIGIKTSQMKSELLAQVDDYVYYRELMYFYNKNKKKYPFITKPVVESMMIDGKMMPITLNRIENKQIEMNKLRRKCGLKPFNAITIINRRIAKYKRSKFGKV